MCWGEMLLAGFCVAHPFVKTVMMSMLGHVHVNFASLFLGYSTDSVTDFSVYSV